MNAGTLVTVAGVAWGIFDTLNQRANAGTTGVPADASAKAGAVPTTGAGAVPPPIPNIPGPPTPSAAGSDDLIRMVRLAVSAAHADGTMGEQERAAVVDAAKAAGGSELLARELGPPRPLAEIVAGVTGQAERATLYVLAFTILRADEQISGAERIYLAQLANLLGLDPEVVRALERDTAERIDAFGHQG
jgi:uncharacterized membrane protein YebE (DUF533 family)